MIVSACHEAKLAKYRGKPAVKCSCGWNRWSPDWTKHDAERMAREHVAGGHLFRDEIKALEP